MIKCLLCPTETAEPAPDTWKPLRVVTHEGGELTLLAGHVCPSHKLTSEPISLAFQYTPPEPPAEVGAEVPAETQAAPAADAAASSAMFSTDVVRRRTTLP